MKKYVLDACALIPLFTEEHGYDEILRLTSEANSDICQLRINQVNLFEVYYYLLKTYGQNKADKMLRDVESSPIKVMLGMEYDVLKESGRLKVTYALSIGDSIAAAESMVTNETLVTADRKDFDKLKRDKKIKILWFGKNKTTQSKTRKH